MRFGCVCVCEPHCGTTLMLHTAHPPPPGAQRSNPLLVVCVSHLSFIVALMYLSSSPGVSP